ncbi:unnamed protein product, partial [Mesorhabditis belari]|uniref:Uncharacterized protein n=1 Tax=Mesorhabditis belari TaxID=2138241 RepID=A0AAF3FJS9_9BILA
MRSICLAVFLILFISANGYKKSKSLKKTTTTEAPTTTEVDYSDSNSTDENVELNFDAAPTEATDLSSTLGLESTTEAAEVNDEDSEENPEATTEAITETTEESKSEDDEEQNEETEPTTTPENIEENSEDKPKTEESQDEEQEESENSEDKPKADDLLDVAKNEVEKEEKQKAEVIDWSFPYPAHSLQEYVQRGKAFARQYIGAKNMKRLHQIVNKVRKSGGGREAIHKAVQSYLNKLLSRKQKKEINQRKAELDATFRFSKDLE